MPTDALKGFVAVSSGTVVPAWISDDTETPLVDVCCTGFLSERAFIYRQGVRGGEHAVRKEWLSFAVRCVFESPQRTYKRESADTSRSLVILCLQRLRLEIIRSLVGV